MTKVIIIGAGNGGLTAAAILATNGISTHILEAHTYPGGCAGTFRRKGYRFDAGATLAGGFNKGEVMDQIGKQLGISSWNAEKSEPSMQIHLPDGTTVRRFGDQRRWEERKEKFGEETLSFWNWQEKTANALWDFAKKSPPFPPQDYRELREFIHITTKWTANNLTSHIHPSMIIDSIVPLGHRLKMYSKRFRRFIDAQLLISAQTIGRYSNSLFAATALDLPRRGVVHMEGGIGTIAKQLEHNFLENGGKIEYKQPVSQITPNGDGYLVKTKKGKQFQSDVVIANLSPWNLRSLMKPTPPKLQRLPTKPNTGWGAFMLYLGIDDKYIQNQGSLHHQVIGKGELSEGNSIFISLSPSWDSTRAPDNKRAITISTHTRFTQWWELYQKDTKAYNNKKEEYTNKVLSLAKKVFPHIEKADLIEPGTPITFEYFTGRKFGWVGGYPQTHLFKTFGPKIAKNLWIVGDSIFPGQSTTAVSLGGLRVARSVIHGGFISRPKLKNNS